MRITRPPQNAFKSIYREYNGFSDDIISLETDNDAAIDAAWAEYCQSEKYRSEDFDDGEPF